MNYKDLIAKITTDKGIKDLCKNVAKGTDLANDLYQHVILILLELEETKIIELETKGYLKFYIVKTVVNQWRTPGNSFAKQYRHLPENINRDRKAFKDFIEENKPHWKADIEKFKDEFKKLYWYDKKLCELYAELGSSREVEKRTGISYRSVCNTVAKVKRKINLN